MIEMNFGEGDNPRQTNKKAFFTPESAENVAFPQEGKCAYGTR
jgi:hypothetical protein